MSESVSVSMYCLLLAGADEFPFDIGLAVADFLGTTLGAGGRDFLDDFFFGISSSSIGRADLFTTNPDFLFLSCLSLSLSADLFFFAFSAELGGAALAGLLIG